MTHVRQHIRDKIVADLKGIPDVDDYVFPNLGRRPNDDEPPLISVRTPEETSAWRHQQLTKTRELQVEITIIGKSRSEAAQDQVDAIAEEVERRLDGNDLGGLLKRAEMELTGTTMENPPEGAEELVFLTLAYTATYHTAQGAPDVAV